MTSRSPQWSVTMQPAENTTIPFDVDLQYPIVATDSKFLAFSAIPGVEPALPSQGHRAHSTSTVATVKSRARTPHNRPQKPRPKKIANISDELIEGIAKEVSDQHGHLSTCPKKARWKCVYCEITINPTPTNVKSHLRAHQPRHRPNPKPARASILLYFCSLGIREPDGQFRRCRFRCRSKQTMTRHRLGRVRHSPHWGDDEPMVFDRATYPDPETVLEPSGSMKVPTWTPATYPNYEYSVDGDSDVDELMSDNDSVVDNENGSRANVRSTFPGKNLADDGGGGDEVGTAHGAIITGTGSSMNNGYNLGYSHNPGYSFNREGSDGYSFDPSYINHTSAYGHNWGHSHSYGHGYGSGSNYYPSMPAYMFPAYAPVGPMLFSGPMGGRTAHHIPTAPYAYLVAGGTGPLRDGGPHAYVDAVNSEETTESRALQPKRKGFLSWEDMLNAPEDS